VPLVALTVTISLPDVYELVYVTEAIPFCVVAVKAESVPVPSVTENVITSPSATKLP